MNQSGSDTTRRIACEAFLIEPAAFGWPNAAIVEAFVSGHCFRVQFHLDLRYFTTEYVTDISRLQIFKKPQSWVTRIPSISQSSLSKLSVMKVSTENAQRSCVNSNVNTEMVENMKLVAAEDTELTVEERNLLSVAYKNVIGARRASWRIVTSIEQKEESKGNSTQVGLIKEYRQKIEAELAKICEDILEVLDKHLIPSAKSGESKVFYHKM